MNDILNKTQLKNDLRNMLFSESNKSLPRGKYYKFMERVIDSLSGEEGAIVLDSLVGENNSLNKFATKAVVEEGVETVAAVALGTNILAKLQEVSYQYKLVAGTNSSSPPFVIRPDDAKVGDHNVQWELQGNETRIRKIISPAEFTDLGSNPIEIIGDIHKPFLLANVIVSMKFNSSPYDKVASGNLLIHDGQSDLFVTEINHFTDPKNVGQFMTSNTESALVESSLHLKTDITDRITGGDSEIIVDLFVVLI